MRSVSLLYFDMIVTFFCITTPHSKLTEVVKYRLQGNRTLFHFYPMHCLLWFFFRNLPNQFSCFFLNYIFILLYVLISNLHFWALNELQLCKWVKWSVCKVFFNRCCEIISCLARNDFFYILLPIYKKRKKAWIENLGRVIQKIIWNIGEPVLFASYPKIVVDLTQIFTLINQLSVLVVLWFTILADWLAFRTLTSTKISPTPTYTFMLSWLGL